MVIILLSIVIRYAYGATTRVNPTPPDSGGYFHRAQLLLNSPSLQTIIGYARTPIFPLILGIPFMINGQLKADFQNPALSTTIMTFLRLQNLTGIIATVIFYIVLTQLKFKSWIALGITLIFGTNLLIIPWEWTVLTESWSVIWTVFFLLILTMYYKKFTVFRCAFLTIVMLIGIFLRPAFLPFGLVLPLIMILFEKTMQKRIATICIFVAVVFSVLLYTICNGIFYHTYVFQSVSAINVIGRVLNKQLPLESAANTIIGKHIIVYRNSGNPLDPFYFMWIEFPGEEDSPKLATDMQQFSTAILLASPISILQSVIKDMPQIIGTVSIDIAISSQSGTQLLFFIQAIDLFILAGSIICSPFLLLHLLIQRRDKKHIMIICLGITTTLIFIPTFFYSYEDYPRFLLPYTPIYLLLFGTFIEEIVNQC